MILDRVPLGTLLRRPPRYGVNAAAVPLRPETLPYLRITDISESGRFALDPKVGVDHVTATDYQLSSGEIVFARTGASVGKTYLYDERDGSLVYAGFLINIAPDPKKLNPKYLQLFTQTREYWNWVALISVRSGQPGINGQEYGLLPVPLVPIEMQEALVAVLSDVDDLIEALERLIKKKQAIKQGMMQQLLTGKTRLPGFTAPWAKVELRDLLIVRHGKSQKQIECSDGRYPILASGGVIGRTNIPIYSKPSVLIGRKGTIDRPQFRDRPFWSVDTLFYTEVADRVDPKYLFFLFTTIDWRSLNEASGVPSLNTSRIEGVSVSVPAIKEQLAIRVVLDDVEVEIDLLESRLIKAKAIKQGMMQELLTGRTLLSVEEGVTV